MNTPKQREHIPSQLEETVLTLCRNAYEVLDTLGTQIPSFTAPHETEKGRALAHGLGLFAVDQLSTGITPTEITEMDLTNSVHELAAAWTSEAVRRLTIEAVYSAYHDSQLESISKVLHGRTITARSLNGETFEMSDGHFARSSPSNPTEFTGGFRNYSPGSGILRLWAPDEHALVRLFDSQTQDQVASIEIH